MQARQGSYRTRGALALLLVIFLTTVDLGAGVRLIRTFKNGHTATNSDSGKQVRDLHIEYTTSINGIGSVGPVKFDGDPTINGKKVDIKFSKALDSGASVGVVASTDSNKLGIKRWWWTDQNGAPMRRKLDSGDVISEYSGVMRGDESDRRNLPKEDLYSIINKSHHWGGEGRLKSQVAITLDIRPLLKKGRKPKELSDEQLKKNVELAVKQVVSCTDLKEYSKVPKAGQGNNPKNDGAGKDPGIMAPGPSHDGAKGEKFRSVTVRECDAILFKYPGPRDSKSQQTKPGLMIEIISDLDDKRPQGQILAGWGTKSSSNIGEGESCPDRKDKTKTASGVIRMNRSKKYHLAVDTDGDEFITNEDADKVPDDAFDFYSVFKHELCHVLCFSHIGSPYFESASSFLPPTPIELPGSSGLRDLSPFPTTGDPDIVQRETLYFASDREFDPGQAGFGGVDIWKAEWDGADWMVSNLGSAVNSPADEMDPFLGSDGVSLLFASDRRGGLGGFDLYEAFVDPDTLDFTEVENLGLRLNSSFDERHPTLRGDMLTLFFSSDRSGGMGGGDIWRSELIEGEGFSEVTNLGSPVNTNADEQEPSISGSGISLFFSSNRHGGLGGYDIWRSLNLEGWSQPGNVTAINTPFDERAPGIRQDGLFLYFSSDRPRGLGTANLYEAAADAALIQQTPQPSGRWPFSGTAGGGTVSADIIGPTGACSVVLLTLAGQTAEEVAEAFADLINSDPCLSLQGVSASSFGGVVVLFGLEVALENTDIADPGLKHENIPTLVSEGLVIFSLLLLATGWWLLRRM